MTEKKMPDYLEMSGPELHATCRDDGHKWAEAFCQAAERLYGIKLDVEWVFGWFANAIEGSCDLRMGTGPVVLPDGSAFFVGTIER